MTDRSDLLAPVAGDAVQIVGGQFRGQSGTLAKRNGNRSAVLLHSPAMRAVQSPDGQWWAASPGHMLPLDPVYPKAEYVVRRT